MIVITKIEYIETKHPTYQLYKEQYKNNDDFTYQFPHKDHIPQILHYEIVQGRRFIRPDKSEIIIGASVKSGELIGIQYEAWDDMDKRISQLRVDLKKSQNVLVSTHRKAVDADFFTRLKWLFTAVKL